MPAVKLPIKSSNGEWTSERVIVTLVIATKKEMFSREKELPCLAAEFLRGMERKFLVRRGLVVVSYLVRKFFSRSQWTNLFHKSCSWFRSWPSDSHENRIPSCKFRRWINHSRRLSRGETREINVQYIYIHAESYIRSYGSEYTFARCRLRRVRTTSVFAHLIDKTLFARLKVPSLGKLLIWTYV